MRFGASRLVCRWVWFVNGCEYVMWQWLNNSISLIEGKALNFSFHFKPQFIYVNETEVQARAEICYLNATGEYWVNGSWFHPTSNETWYILSVAAPIPADITAVKVVVHGRPDFKAWVDSASIETT